MEFFFGFLVLGIIFIIILFILYGIVDRAIQDSGIKERLVEVEERIIQMEKRNLEEKREEELKIEEDENPKNERFIEYCPACGEIVTEQDKSCPRCELTLIS